MGGCQEFKVPSNTTGYRSVWTARLCFKETNNKKFLVIQPDTQQKADPANP